MDASDFAITGMDAARHAPAFRLEPGQRVRFTGEGTVMPARHHCWFASGGPLRTQAWQQARLDYDEGERLMTQAARTVAALGGHMATPAQLRAQNADYLARLAAIVRSGAEDPDQVLALAGGDKSGVSWG